MLKIYQNEFLKIKIFTEAFSIYRTVSVALNLILTINDVEMLQCGVGVVATTYC